MASTGRTSSSWAAAVSCCAAVGALAGCSGSDAPSDGPSREVAGAETCLTDLTAPTSTYEVEVAAAEVLRPDVFLTAEAAVVQELDERVQYRPHVLGDNVALQKALDDTHMRAVAGEGFIVQAPVEADRGITDADELTILDARGEPLLEGPRVDRNAFVQAVGDQFVVADRAGGRTVYDMATGAEEEPGPAVFDRGQTRPSLASTVVLTDEGEQGGVIDARTARTFGYDELLEEGVDEVSVAGSGADRVLLSGDVDDRTTRFWTWGAASGLREAYTTDAEDASGDGASPGVCGDYLYLVEDDELRVIDTGADGTVVGRRPLPVDLSAGDSCDVIAIPGAVLVVEADEAPGTWRYTWFDD